MTAAEAKAAFEDLVSRCGLRYTERTRRYVGIYEGVCFDVALFQQCIQLNAIAPAAVINSQILEDFSGFTHVKNSGVPTTWIRGVRGETGNHPNQVEMELTPQRLQHLTEKQFFDLPMNLIQDFRAFGAEPTIPHCGVCGTAVPNTLMMIDNHYVPACENCLARVRDEAAVGELQNTAPVQWTYAVPALLVGASLYTLLWGGMQQIAMPAKLLLVGPFFAAIMFSVAVGSFAGGTSFLLRMLTAAATVAAVLAGNIWGTRTLVEKQFQELVSWEEATRIYFELRLFQHQQEGYFLIGGLAGAWLGSRMAKEATRVRVD